MGHRVEEEHIGLVRVPLPGSRSAPPRRPTAQRPTATRSPAGPAVQATPLPVTRSPSVPVRREAPRVRPGPQGHRNPRTAQPERDRHRSRRHQPKSALPPAPLRGGRCPSQSARVRCAIAFRKQQPSTATLPIATGVARGRKKSARRRDVARGLAAIRGASRPALTARNVRANCSIFGNGGVLRFLPERRGHRRVCANCSVSTRRLLGKCRLLGGHTRGPAACTAARSWGSGRSSRSANSVAHRSRSRSAVRSKLQLVVSDDGSAPGRDGVRAPRPAT